MIRLPSKVSQSGILVELLKKANYEYEHSWQPQLRIKAYTHGVIDTLNLLKHIAKQQSSEHRDSTNVEVVE
jgi:hypothetical protein